MHIYPRSQAESQLTFATLLLPCTGHMSSAALNRAEVPEMPCREFGVQGLQFFTSIITFGGLHESKLRRPAQQRETVQRLLLSLTRSKVKIDLFEYWLKVISLWWCRQGARDGEPDIARHASTHEKSEG
jgi:hypothetical protein